METADRTIGRSRAYALFAEAFGFPQGESVIRLLDGDLMAELKDAIALTSYSIATVDEMALPNTKNAIQEMQVIYTELFDVTAGTPKVSLLERRYRDTPEQELWEKLLRFYTHFGLDFSQGEVEEQPDHLFTELGFMHYLSFLEAGCKKDQDRISIQRGQRDFLQLHIGSWAAKLAANLAQQKTINPYAEISRLAAELVRCDTAYLAELLAAETESEPTEH